MAAEDAVSDDPVQAIQQRWSLGAIGVVEPVEIVDVGCVYAARIDTGATTTSIDARAITAFERDGEAWVRFDIPVVDGVQTFERRVIDKVEIKRHGAEPQFVLVSAYKFDSVRWM